jgi:hypothetical protein
MSDTAFTAQRWQAFWENFKGEPQQLAGIEELRQAIVDCNPVLMDEGASWVRNFHKAPPAPAAPAFNNPLQVKWQSQLDNKSGTGYRECFSSSCAMLAMYWGAIDNDDAYNAIRSKYGDSTSNEAQLLALRSLGLHANFHTDGTPASLKAEINAGRPVAVGWLHKGPAHAPSGGGHWSVVISCDDDHWILNDPNGEADLVNGGYTPNTNGAGVVYSRKNWEPRWMPGGSGGWYLTCRGGQ